MNNRTLDRPKAVEGLRPAFSAHVRRCEHGAPVECAAAGTVHCSLNLTQASRLLGMTHWGAVSLLDMGSWNRRNSRSLDPTNSSQMEAPPSPCHPDRSVPGFPTSQSQQRPRMRLSVKRAARTSSASLHSTGNPGERSEGPAVFFGIHGPRPKLLQEAARDARSTSTLRRLDTTPPLRTKARPMTRSTA